MKSPFRYQVSESDCFPTSILNALGYLFDRSDIPGAVIQRIYLYSLDGVGRGQRIADGTTNEGARLLIEWIRTYRTRHFKVGTDFLRGDRVTLEPQGAIARTLRGGGLAICDVSDQQRYWHSMLVLGIKDGWVECWDPYYRRALKKMAHHAEWNPAATHSANLRVQVRWMNAPRSASLRLGPVGGRSAVLLWRE